MQDGEEKAERHIETEARCGSRELPASVQRDGCADSKARQSVEPSGWEEIH